MMLRGLISGLSDSMIWILVNGLDNVALESVAKTAWLDTFSNNDNKNVNSLVITKTLPTVDMILIVLVCGDVLRDTIFANT